MSLWSVTRRCGTALALGGGVLSLLGATCRAFSDHLPMANRVQTSVSPPVVRVAFGWRAREVERQSTAPVTFPDDDVSADILENEPVALAYAEPAHAFTLPPGRFLRVDQTAGRVYDATATPHLAALTPAEAVALADSVAHLFQHAGWAPVPSAGRGSATAVADAVRYGTGGKGGFGVADVGTWRVPRPAAVWAARPADAPARPNYWDGVEGRISVRPLRAGVTAAGVKLIVQVKLVDVSLSSALFAMSEARRGRHGGEMQTLRSWDAQPAEPMASRR